jgi:hypothetical protein
MFSRTRMLLRESLCNPIYRVLITQADDGMWLHDCSRRARPFTEIIDLFSSAVPRACVGTTDIWFHQSAYELALDVLCRHHMGGCDVVSHSGVCTRDL